MKDNQKAALGIDIGGTSVKVCLVNTKGEISNLCKVPTIVEPNKQENFIEEICDTAMEITKQSDFQVVGCGVSCLGLQNLEASGPYLTVNVPQLNDYDIRTNLQQRLQMPVTITNDLMSHALAEYTFGCGKGASRFLCIAMGTGIGAGVVINGNPVKLWGGASGDHGRIVLEPTSEIVCAGGVRGSAEALCGVAGIEWYAKNAYQKENITAREVITACREGDPIAEEVIAKVGSHVGHLIAILSMIFAPTRVAIAGGTTNAGPILINSCKNKFREIAGEFFDMLTTASPNIHPELDICYGEIKGEAGVVGGAVEVLKPYL